ncbi:MAG TPA: class I SAM-dependent methyltransferase [Verrucomicrobiae bacterium]|nr:class I SAM-dependent methyltransferase [Verrucomicrobiae bacterium]
MGLKNYLKSKALRWALPMPFECVHHAYSTISYFEGNPTDRLLDISIRAADEARKIDLKWLSDRMKEDQRTPGIWPGQHYRLLAALLRVVKPVRIVEVGTFTGASALAMKAHMLAGAQLVTVDIVPWHQFERTALKESDFQDGSLRQAIGDLAEENFFRDFSGTLEECDFLFVDGPKNVVFEERFLRQLAGLKLAKNPLVVLDDIRLWNMLKIWDEISRPKLDLTSFGHYTGTGIIDWNGHVPKRPETAIKH